MADVASKQQTTALFLSPIVTRTRRHIELTKKLTNLMGNLCCTRELQFSFSCSFFTQLNCTVYLRVYGALNTPTKIGSRPHDMNTETHLVSETLSFEPQHYVRIL